MDSLQMFFYIITDILYRLLAFQSVIIFVVDIHLENATVVHYSAESSTTAEATVDLIQGPSLVHYDPLRTFSLTKKFQ